MCENGYVTVDGVETQIRGERNLLELIRGIGIDIPTFCYHSELSIYGACRLCIVDIEGRGIVTSCSTRPEDGMKVRTNTEEIRQMRRIALELLLANHDRDCPTCAKNRTCKLQELALRLGVEEVRFKPTEKKAPIDRSSVCLVRDPNKCILCGDCVRMCHEVQGVGAIDFAHRGQDVAVVPSFGKDLDQVECVNCGQCARVCPTGALTIKFDTDPVWKLLHDEKKTVVAQIAPAVRVALGEMFGMEPGTVTIGQTVAALKAIGFDKVYDTSFAADMTVIEEGTEFLERMDKGRDIPQFTSCCPAWVKFAEQYYPELIPNLSSCRSPQQMFGSVARQVLPGLLEVANEDLAVISIMPCTAKKYEARRPEFQNGSVSDVDYVLTTQEIGRMIAEAGLDFRSLKPESLDLPLGFKSGAGVIFGNSGGVSEAVLRYAAEKISGIALENVDFKQVRGQKGLREATITVGSVELKLAIVHGLANAGRVADQVRAGEADYHFIEVMSCPGGCIGGAGQPVSADRDFRAMRTEGLYSADKMLQIHKSQDNPAVAICYGGTIGEPCGEQAHKLLHTRYQSRKRIGGSGINLMGGSGDDKLEISVCVGTSCFVRGSQALLQALIHHIEQNGLDDLVEVKATFCMERCGKGPNVKIGATVIEHCTLEKALEVLSDSLAQVTV